MSTIGERLKGFRELSKLSARQLGDILSMSTSNVYEIEKNRNNLSNKAQQILYKEFNLNLNWLISGEGKMFLPEKDKETPKQDKEVEILTFYRNNKDYQELLNILTHIVRTESRFIKTFKEMLKTLLPSDKK